jgi:hypothetical protein
MILRIATPSEFNVLHPQPKKHRIRPKVAAGSLAELAPQAAHKFRGHFRDTHALGNQEFATQDGTRLVVIGKLATHTAVLAFLIPTEPAVWDRLRADELEGAQERVPLRHQKRFAQNRDFDKLLVRPKDFCHG